MKKHLFQILLFAIGAFFLVLAGYSMRGENCHEGWVIRSIQYGTICEGVQR